MKTLFLLPLCLLSISAFADMGRGDPANGPTNATYDLTARGATCEGARALINRRGAVIVYYGQDMYDRVVRDSSFCEMGYQAQPYYAPGKNCFLGYSCETINGG